MPQAEFAIGRSDGQEEDARLKALASTGILDTAPEANFDAITRLAAEYFKSRHSFAGVCRREPGVDQVVLGRAGAGAAAEAIDL